MRHSAIESGNTNGDQAGAVIVSSDLRPGTPGENVYLARMALADLALDPFHISGGATSVATLSAGVPVLTLRGNSYLARMGSSINARLGMDDLDCMDPEHYIAKAVVLATMSSELSAVKERLGEARQTSDLFNTKAFVSRLEEALQMVWDRHQSGQTPAHIQISESLQL